jgi:hypothetical protein
MQRSIFLAKLIGPLFLVIGVSLLANFEGYRLMIDQFLHNYALIYLSGIITLLAGLAIFNLHNLWVRDWRVAITILGWLCVIGGVVRITVPQHAAAIGAAEVTHQGFLIGVGIVVALIGAWLSYMGYAWQTPQKRGGRK